MGDLSEGAKWQTRLTETSKRLAEVSPSFCAAKWLQSTLHLESGTTHSCHHPPSHKIPGAELAQNIDALHNTSFKKSQRDRMLKGERPEECAHCWKVEDAAPDAFSDRHIKSSDEWAVDLIETLPALERPTPTYLEVSFSSKCQMRCMYCSPEISSAIWDEIATAGLYPVKERGPDTQWLGEHDLRPLSPGEANPYVDAFWGWFPVVVPQLRVLRITGGEPLLHDSTFTLLERLHELGHPALEVDVNTNLMVAGALLDRLVDTLVQLKAEDKIRRFRIYTSVDTAGRDAEYIRYGLSYDKLLANCDRILARHPAAALTLICTHNILSLPRFGQFMEDVHALKSRHISKIEPVPRVMLDLTYLRMPSYLSSRLAPRRARRCMRRVLAEMEAKTERIELPAGFNAYEMNKMRRLCDWLEAPKAIEELQDRSEKLRDFVHFVTEYDRRKGRNFRQVFPDYTEFIEALARRFLKPRRKSPGQPSP
jgi:pyruvate-formate lyase-activating enzyme